MCKNQKLLPRIAYSNLDLSYDIKTFEQLEEVLKTGYNYGVKLSKKDMKDIKKCVKDFNIDFINKTGI